MLEELKKQVCEANLELVRRGVVIYTWGNVSGIDRERELVVIKPSGVNYDGMKPKDMVVVDLKNGKTIEGELKPSSDTDLIFLNSWSGFICFLLFSAIFVSPGPN